MTSAQAWKLILGDIGHFLAYFGFPLPILISFVIGADRHEADAALESVFFSVGFIWGIWVCGKSAGYWA